MRLLRLKYVPWFPFSTKWSHRDQIFSSHLEQLKSKTKYVDETMVSKTDQLRTKSLERWGQWGEPVTDQLAALRELPERLSHLGLQAPGTPGRTARIRGSYPSPKGSHSQDSSFSLRGQHGSWGTVKHSEFLLSSRAKLTFHWALPSVSDWTKGIWRGHVAQRPSHLQFCGLSSTDKTLQGCVCIS